MFLEHFLLKSQVCDTGKEEEEEKSCFLHSNKSHGWYIPTKTTVPVEEITTYSMCVHTPPRVSQKHTFSSWLHWKDLGDLKQPLCLCCLESATQVLERTHSWLQLVLRSRQETDLSYMMRSGLASVVSSRVCPERTDQLSVGRADSF